MLTGSQYDSSLQIRCVHVQLYSTSFPANLCVCVCLCVCVKHTNMLLFGYCMHAFSDQSSVLGLSDNNDW